MAYISTIKEPVPKSLSQKKQSHRCAAGVPENQPEGAQVIIQNKKWRFPDSDISQKYCFISRLIY